MKLRGFFLLNTFFFFLTLCITPIFAEVIVEPFGTAILIEDELEEEFIITLANESDAEINFEIGFDVMDVINPEEERDNIRRRVRRITSGPVARLSNYEANIDLTPPASIIENQSNTADSEPLDFGPGRDEPNELRILLIKAENDPAFGWHNNDDWLQVFNDQDPEPDQANIENLGDIDLSDYDLLATGEDQDASFYQAYNQNREQIDEYIDGGGLFSFFTGSNSFQDISLPSNDGDVQVTRGPNGDWGDVNQDFINDDGDGLIEGIEEDFPILTPYENFRDDQESPDRVRIRMRGNSLNYSIIQRADLPEEAVWYYRPEQQENTTIIADWPFGRGYVLFTGITGTLFIRQNYLWSSGMECVNLTRWADFAGGARWLQIEPEEGVIEPDGDVDLNVMLLAEEMEVGTHYAVVEIVLDDPNQDLIQIPVMMSIDAPIFDLFGVVVDESNGETLDQVNVRTYPYDFRRRTDGGGEVEIMSLPSDEYDVHFSLLDYLPQVASFEVGDNDEINLEIAMLHSQCNLDVEEIIDELPVDGQSETAITISNDGNGPLTYTSDKRLLGDANAEPWELRAGVPAGVITEDSRIQGAVFDGDNFYLSGSNNRDPLIYVLNRDQELVDQYGQLGEGRYGYKDLAYDGEWIWGSGERVVYGFTANGDGVTSFDTGISPCNNLAWDSDRDLLWLSGTTTEIFGFDREGNLVAEVSRGNLRVYGLAYWPDDPDGYQLYIFHKINDVGDLMIAKLDIENDELMDVVNLEHEIGGVAQGCFITNQYDIYSWVFMGIANNGAEDRVDIWQVDARKDWMDIDPTEGVIAAGEQQEFLVTLDATGLPQAPFEGEIVFTHDGIGGETHLPITLQVGEGGGPEEMTLDLANGWNMVSAYVQPDPDDIVEIMTDLVEAGSLIMVKNGAGQFYNPQFNFNNIPGWLVDEGYMVKMDGADELTLSGMPVPWDEQIALDGGWQMISYYPRQGVDAVLALSGIVDVLIMAKDGQGRFYNPQFNFSNMGEMVPGQGYLVKMDEAAELVYTVEEGVASLSTPYLQPEILSVHHNTGENMSLLILSDLSEGEVGVYSNNVLVGSGVIQAGRCGVSVWGDDPTTSRIDGAFNGDDLEIKYWDGSRLIEPGIEKIHGDVKYSTDDFNVVRLLDVNVTPENFGIVSAYPNPFNSFTSITINLKEAAGIDFSLFDLNGRNVADIASGKIKAGIHTFTLDGSFLSSGVYIAQLQSSGKDYKHKLTLIK